VGNQWLIQLLHHSMVEVVEKCMLGVLMPPTCKSNTVKATCKLQYYLD